MKFNNEKMIEHRKFKEKNFVNLSPHLKFYLDFIANYEGKSKVWQYFSHMEHNLAALDAFAKVINLTSHTGVSDAKLI